MIAHAYRDGLDDDLDALDQWGQVLDAATTHLSDTELLCFVLYFLGHNTEQIARVLTGRQGQEGVSRERARQHLRVALHKIFAVLHAGEPPPLTDFMPRRSFYNEGGAP